MTFFFIGSLKPTMRARVADNVSGFDNINSRREDVVLPFQIRFQEAIGIFKLRLHQSYDPVFWVDFILKLPEKLISYFNLPISTSIMNIIQVIYWIFMVGFGLNKIGVIDALSW